MADLPKKTLGMNRKAREARQPRGFQKCLHLNIYSGTLTDRAFVNSRAAQEPSTYLQAVSTKYSDSTPHQHTEPAETRKGTALYPTGNGRGGEKAPWESLCLWPPSAASC